MQPLWLTLWLMLAAVLIAVPLGVATAVAAVCCGSTQGSRLVRWLFAVTMLCAVALPMYLHAAGWESAAGKFGWIPLMQTSGRRFWISGFLATAWIHGVSGAAWVALATTWGLSRIPRNLIDVAALDAGRLGSLRAVALPLALPAMAAGALWVAMLAATEMTVADLYGVRTLADLVYLQFAFDPEPFAIALSCLAPALVALPLLYLLTQLTGRVAREETSPAVGFRLERFASGPSAAGVFPAAVVLVALILVLALPLFSLFVRAGWEAVGGPGALERGVPLRYGWSFDRFWTTMVQAFRTFHTEYTWTAVLAVATAIPAVVLAWLAAAWAERSRLFARLALAAAMLLVLLPGPVVGMLIIEMFHGRGEWLTRMYSETLIPSICGQLVRAGPAAYLVVRAGYRMLDRRVDDAAAVDGASLAARILRVDGPRLVGTLSLAGVVAALVTVADIPASLLVLPPSVSTVGTRIFGLLHSGVRYQESGLAIGFCLVFALVIALLGLLLRLHARISARRFL